MSLRIMCGYIECSMCLCAVVAIVPNTVSAQEISLDSLEQAVDLEPGEGDRLDFFRLSGFGVGAFNFRSGSEQNSFSASKLAISAFKRSGPYLSFFGQITNVLEPSDPAAAEPTVATDPTAADEEGATLETEIDNLIVSFTPPGADEVNIWFGRFDVPFGFERDDEPLNFQPTNSFNFEFARPIKFTGVMVNYTPLPVVSLSTFVVNGWDQTVDNNKGKTVGARVSFLPYEFSALSVTGVYGPEKDDNTSDQRFLLDIDFTAQPLNSLILGGEFNFGTEENSAIDGGDADWVGGSLTSFLRLTGNVGITVRYDVFDDTDGARTGDKRTLQSLTLAPMLFFRSATSGIYSTIPQTGFSLPEFSLRAGLRFDHSNNDFFNGDNGSLQNTETRFILEGVFVY
ncbi:MAG: outer membrane beta-barrel protein [Gemmatimonadales bacterium]